MNSVLLDRRDSAKYLGISVSNLDRLRAAGELPAVQYRHKGNVRYREEDLRKFIEQRLDGVARGRADFCPSFRGGNGKRGGVIDAPEKRKDSSSKWNRVLL